MKSQIEHYVDSERGLIQQALYCYRKACQVDLEGVDAFWELAVLSKETGNLQEVSVIPKPF